MNGIQSPSEQQNFVERVLPAATCNMLLDQLGAAYAEWLVRGGIELLVCRWLGSSQEFEPVLRWLPHDPTIAMGAALAASARQHRAAEIGGAEVRTGKVGIAKLSWSEVWIGLNSLD